MKNTYPNILVGKFFPFFKDFGIHVIGKKNRSFESGLEYEKKLFDRLVSSMNVSAPAGASSRCDLTVTLEDGFTINFEIKNKGAFEGGSVKLSKDMRIEKECIQKEILGDTILYGGEILPWYLGKRRYSDWKEKKHVFGKDVYIKASPDAISEYYYNHRGVHYIQIEKLGLYHTKSDILKLGTPKFTCEDCVLRVRCTKHKKNGIPTDITAALQYNRRLIQKSPLDLEVLQSLKIV